MNLSQPTIFNIHQIRLILAYVFLSAFIISCKKDSVEIIDLKFPLDTYYVSEGDEMSLHINSGNQKYSLSVSDEALIETTINATNWPVGSIQVKGLKKGSTQLTVKDEVTSQEVILQIHIVDPYLIMKAVHLIPVIEGANYETDLSIRNEVRNESQNFAAFGEGEVLILQRNADHRFSIFKSEEDVERGVIHKSGNYSLGFYYGGPNRLTLYYPDTEEMAEFPIHVPNDETFFKLLDFSREDSFDTKKIAAHSNVKTQSMNGPSAEVIQNTSPVSSYNFYLIRDFTTYFQATYPDVKRVELFQAINFYPTYHQLNFGEGVLK